MTATNQNTPRPADGELTVYTVTVDLNTAELVARDTNGRELARTDQDGAEDHGDLARKAAETLISWYN